ncbi:ABC transporter substrate-binding protein [Bifidobacterium pseudocatenulatum]|uniref:ABC transporter substrate-binding protein n=1 Tax=Bifidobacterium pseudocatenulatum TaxID=28026 RepID=UPI0022E4F034|nr:extracellular solute-binding protein [Bifidobacterium pseudocatenulatum]
MRSHTQRLMVCAASFAALCMGLAGCGSNTASTGGDSGEVVNLTYMHRLPDSEGMTLVKDIVAKWNKDHPNIQVKATKFDGAAQDMIKKLETDVKAGNAPDLAQVGYAEVPEVFTKGLLEDVTEEAAKYKSDFAEGPYSMMQVDGKTYGLPQDTGPLVYFYNQKAFDELGIKVPKTKDELIEAAKTAAASGKYIMDYEADEAGNIFAGLANASDPWYTVKNDAWVVNTNGSGSQAFAETFQELIDNKATLTNPRWVPSFDASLQDGTLIGNIGAAWEAPLFKDSAGDTGKGDWRVTQIGDWFGNGTSTETAKTPESWNEFYGGQDVMKEFATANDNMVAFNYMPGYSAVSAAMQEAADKAADGSGKVADVFPVAQQTSIDTLKNYGLSVAK